MDGFQMLIFILGILFGAFTFFLPAVIVKKLIIDRVTITLIVKIITMFLLGTATLLFADILAYTINGGIPSTNKWALWMLIDYYYLFHFKMKKRDNINPKLYADIAEYEKSQKTESSQTDSNVKSIEPSDSQREPAQQPDEKSNLLSQLGNLSEDELKAVVKLASALSSIKEDKQKD